MYTEFAAHVGHGVSHSSTAGRLIMGAGAAAAFVGLAAACSTGVGTVACIGGAATAGGLGMDAGEVIDKMMAPSITERLKTGIDSVFLSPALKNAARAFEDTITDGDGEKVGEGSELVMLGKELRPMSRRADRVLCGGTIVEGCMTIVVGGNPSMMGKKIDEKDTFAVKLMSAAFSLGQMGKSAAEKQVLSTVSNAIGTTLEMADQKDLAGAAKLGTITKPKDLLEKIDTLNTGRKGADGIINLGSDLLH